LEAGCDEAGRGCLAGPVVAAAVILPVKFNHPLLDDSKKLSERQRSVDNLKIDEINILNASFMAMHLALDSLKKKFEFILVDGNRFKPYKKVPHLTIVEGDGKYLSIAAASILAKTYRDEYMESAHHQYPQYGWLQNKGYATAQHRKVMLEMGQTPLHRKSFVLKETQMKMW